MLVDNCTKNTLTRLTKLNFPDYAVDIYGKVYSYKKGFNQLKASLDGQGYAVVKLFRNGRSKTFTVHRLVALCYVPNPKNKPYVVHKNLERTDNRASNLLWANAFELNRNKIKVTQQIIDFIVDKYKNGLTQYEIAKELKLSQTTICNVIRNINQ